MSEQSGWPHPGQWPGWQPPTPVRPPAMDRAVWLLRLGAALTAVGTVVNLLLNDPNDFGQSSNFGGPNNVVDDGTLDAIGYTSAGFTLLVSVGVWLWMSWANGRGKAWARTLATVLGCVNAGFWLLGVAALAILQSDLVGDSSPRLWTGSVTTLATLVAGFSALWLMYRPESSEFYAASSAPRPPYGWPAYGPPYPNQYQQPQYPQQPPPPPGSSSP